MPQLSFDHLRERLLRAGIAPRHVRRYIGELRDHYDDLVREETATGATRGAAEATAQSRLGNDDDLANVMLARPGLRSVASRYPWAVFGLGPIALLVASLAAAILAEVGVLTAVSAVTHAQGLTVRPSTLRSFVFGVEIWNTLVVYGAPLGIAALLAFVGARQRSAAGWIFAGVAIACVLGGFQNLVWYDTGTHGELSLNSGLTPPYSHFAQGVLRAAANLAVVGVAWWLARRGSVSPTMDSAEFDTSAMHSRTS